MLMSKSFSINKSIIENWKRKLILNMDIKGCVRKRRQQQPTPVFLPGESQGRGCLVGCCLWGHTESEMTEVTQQQQQKKERRILCILEYTDTINIHKLYTNLKMGDANLIHTLSLKDKMSMFTNIQGTSTFIFNQIIN